MNRFSDRSGDIAQSPGLMRPADGDTLAEISCTLSMEDILEGAVFAASNNPVLQERDRRSRFTSIVVGVSMLIPVVAASILCFRGSMRPHGLGLALVAAMSVPPFCAAAVCFLGSISKSNRLVALRTGYRRAARQGGLSGDFGPRTIRLTSEGVVLQGGYGSAFRRWRGITSVHRATDVLLLRLNVVQSIPVPLRAFGSSQESDRFEQICARQIELHGGGADPLVIEHLRTHNPQCPKCKYQLGGLQTSKCPECGLESNLGLLTM